MLAATSLLAGFWCIATNRYSGSAALASAFGVGILEALVWGFFWSPRCKTQVTALLATYFCASLFAYLAAAVCASSSHDVAAAYVSAIPIRLIIVALVAGFAVRGMSRWFEDSVQKQEKPAGWKFGNGNLARPSATVLPDGERGMMIAQKRVRSPFFSLLYQSFRQSSTLMLFGLGMVAALLGCGYYLYRCNAAQYVWSSDAFDLVVPGMVFGIFYLIFCGGIFAADDSCIYSNVRAFLCPKNKLPNIISKSKTK